PKDQTGLRLYRKAEWEERRGITGGTRQKSSNHARGSAISIRQEFVTCCDLGGLQCIVRVFWVDGIPDLQIVSGRTAAVRGVGNQPSFCPLPSWLPGVQSSSSSYI